MQRGVLILTKSELESLRSRLEEEDCKGELFYSKIDNAFSNIKDSNQIFLSEEEAERILDIIGIQEDQTGDIVARHIGEFLRGIRRS